MTPFASVAMLEKLALLKIARCRAPAFRSTSSACTRRVMSTALSDAPIVPVAFFASAMATLVSEQFGHRVKRLHVLRNDHHDDRNAEEHPPDSPQPAPEQQRYEDRSRIHAGDSSDHPRSDEGSDDRG